MNITCRHGGAVVGRRARCTSHNSRVTNIDGMCNIRTSEASEASGCRNEHFVPSRHCLQMIAGLRTLPISLRSAHNSMNSGMSRAYFPPSFEHMLRRPANPLPVCMSCPPESTECVIQICKDVPTMACWPGISIPMVETAASRDSELSAAKQIACAQTHFFFLVSALHE